MADAPGSGRKFNEEEVALIIKRAAELQQVEEVEETSSNALSLAEVEQIAKEAGIDPALVRRAANSLDRPVETSRPSPWVGAPTRIIYERAVDGEISNDEFEALVDTIRRAIGENGVPSVLGRTLSWSSTLRGGRRRNRGRHIDVSIMSRGGVTTIRVEEELRDIAGALFGGLLGGGAGGTSGISFGIGMGEFHSAAIAGMLWFGIAGGFYVLARTIFGNISHKRDKQLRELANRLEEQVTSAIENKPAQVGASTPRALGAGEDSARTD
ncbi:MAG TPA: hypothetical protein VF042_00105 [Gemmatimonadaceae bacterium]